MCRRPIDPIGHQADIDPTAPASAAMFQEGDYVGGAIGLAVVGISEYLEGLADSLPVVTRAEANRQIKFARSSFFAGRFRRAADCIESLEHELRSWESRASGDGSK